MSEQFAILKRANVVRSTTNPRTVFNPAKLQELAESIKAAGGVLQPLLVRPLPAWRVPDTARNVTHEIVCGERRDRGCEIAGIDEYPVMIRDLKDEQVREIQLVENLQRDDLTALEEAEGYSSLMEHSKLNADQVAEKIGKSRTYVFNRLKLLDLGTDGRAALRDGKIDYSVAMLVARIPDGKLQAKFLQEVLRGERYYSGDREPLSYRSALRLAQDEYMLKLSDARFTITVVDLVPGVGSCKECNKRTGANPDLFSDVKSADVCTDPPCFHKKEEAAAALLVKEAKAKGQTVIAGKEAEELRIGYGASARFKGYKRLDDKEDSPTGEPLRKILGKLMDEKGIKPTMLEHPTKKGQLVACLPNDVANSLLKTIQEQAKADKKAAPKAVQDLLDEKADQEKAKLDAKFRREVHAQAIAETWKKIQSRGNAEMNHPGALFNLDIHRHLAGHTAWSLDADGAEAASKVLATGSVGAQHGLRDLVKKHPRPDLLHLLLIMHSRSGEGFELVTKAVHREDLKAVTKRIETEVRERVYPKPAKKAPATTAPAAQAQGVRGKAGAKTKPAPAAAAKISPEEAKRGIADAMQGLEGSASAPKGAVAPSAAPGALTPAAAWPFPKTPERTPAQAAAAAAAKATEEAAQEEPTDPLFKKARALVLKEQQANKRQLKEGLGIGQDKAMALLDQLEAAGVIGPAVPRQPRDVLLDKKGNARGAA